jgi:hypothetical protein
MIPHSSASVPPDKVLTISRWDDVFETAASRKLVRLSYVNAPSGVDSAGYIELVTGYDIEGVIALGVFTALCQLTATWTYERRGKFLKTNGVPYSLTQLSALLRISENTLREAIAILSHDDIGWLRWECASHPPVIRQSSATNLPPNRRKEEKEEEEGIEGREGGSPTPAGGDAEAVIEEGRALPQVPAPGFPEKATVIAYCEKQGWDVKSGVRFWCHFDQARSNGQPLSANWHWWSRLETWVMNDAQGGDRGPSSGLARRPAKTTINDYDRPEDWTPEQINLHPSKA